MRMHFLLFMCLIFSIGTHYFRGINNLQQPWNSWTGRKKLELKPNNPTEEGLASIHSVLFRKKNKVIDAHFPKARLRGRMSLLARIVLL